MPAKIAIITYSMYGHIDKLADAMEEGVKASGASATRFQLPETLSAEVLEKMHAGSKNAHPVLDDPEKLKEFDGFLFGFPTRYSRAPAQVSTFFDRTGGLWMSGALVGKFAGLFTSTASQHGGHEATFLSTIPFLAHQGLIYVPIGFANPNVMDNTEVLGGTPWGATTLAGGDGSRQPHPKELDVSNYQGKRFGEIVNQFVAGGKRSAAIAGNAQPYVVTAADVPEAPEPQLLQSEQFQTRVDPSKSKTMADAPELKTPAGDHESGAEQAPGQEKKKKAGLAFVKKLSLSCGGGSGNYET